MSEIELEKASEAYWKPINEIMFKTGFGIRDDPDGNPHCTCCGCYPDERESHRNSCIVGELYEFDYEQAAKEVLDASGLAKRVNELEEALKGCLRTAWHDDSCPAVDIDEHNRRNCNCGYLEAYEQAQNLLNEPKGDR